MINWGRKRNRRSCFSSRGVQCYLVCSHLRLGLFYLEWFRVSHAKICFSFANFLVFLEIVVVNHIGRAAAKSVPGLGFLQDAKG